MNDLFYNSNLHNRLFIINKTNMKILLFLISFILFSGTAQSQEETSKTITKYIITHATKNDVDITENLLKEKSYLVLYKNNNPESNPDIEEMFFANVWDVSDSQSFGRIYNLKSTGTGETEESYKTSTLDFNWSYQNSYNNDSGTAKVKILTVFKPAGITFSITILAEDLEIFNYKGYVDGSLNNSVSEEIKDNEFTRSYNRVRTFDVDSNEWSEWAAGRNTFIFNINSNNDIKHNRANGDEILYKNNSDVEEGITEDGRSYEEIYMKDEDGLGFRLQLYNESSIGLKMIYKDLIFHFSEQ